VASLLKESRGAGAHTLDLSGIGMRGEYFIEFRAEGRRTALPVRLD
jgi:hypothetical protein